MACRGFTQFPEVWASILPTDLLRVHLNREPKQLFNIGPSTPVLSLMERAQKNQTIGSSITEHNPLHWGYKQILTSWPKLLHPPTLPYTPCSVFVDYLALTASQVSIQVLFVSSAFICVEHPIAFRQRGHDSVATTPRALVWEALHVWLQLCSAHLTL